MSGSTHARTRVTIELSGFPRHESETVWAHHVEEDLFRIANAPFLTSEVHLNDLIRVEGDGDERRFVEVFRSSGATTERFLFPGSVAPEDEHERLQTLEAYGAVIEHASNRFYAMGASVDAKQKSIEAQLQFWRKKQFLMLAEDEESLVRLSHALADRPLIHWGFSLPRETPVLTVRDIRSGDAPVQHVVRSPEPPQFQLLGWSTPTEEDAELCFLGDLVDQDASLHELADLPPGWHAYREEAGDPWTREAYDN